MGASQQYHVERREGVCGSASVIKGSRIPVWVLASYWRAGVTAEELLTYYPHLSMGQIFGALSYYADHQREIDTEIAANRVAPTKVHPLVREERRRRRGKLAGPRKLASQ